MENEEECAYRKSDLLHRENESNLWDLENATGYRMYNAVQRLCTTTKITSGSDNIPEKHDRTILSCCGAACISLYFSSVSDLFDRAVGRPVSAASSSSSSSHAFNGNVVPRVGSSVRVCVWVSGRPFVGTTTINVSTDTRDAPEGTKGWVFVEFGSRSPHEEPPPFMRLLRFSLRRVLFHKNTRTGPKSLPSR